MGGGVDYNEFVHPLTAQLCECENAGQDWGNLMKTLPTTLVACGVFCVGPAPASATDRRPNVVIVPADGQGWGDLSVHGNVNLHTPHIDSLARNGAIFDRFLCLPGLLANTGEIPDGTLPSTQRR